MEIDEYIIPTFKCIPHKFDLLVVISLYLIT